MIKTAGDAGGRSTERPYVRRFEGSIFVNA